MIKKLEKRKSLILFSILILFIVSVLLISAGYGRVPVGFTLKSNDFQKIEKPLQNYVNSLKSLYLELKNKGLISSYQYDYIISEVDKAYQNISNTKTIYFPFGELGVKKDGFREMVKRKLMQNRNDKGERKNVQNEQRNQYYQKIKESYKFSDYEKIITNIFNSKNELIDSFVNIGLLTKFQADTIKEREKFLFDNMKKDNIFSPFYGSKFLFDISGIYLQQKNN